MHVASHIAFVLFDKAKEEWLEGGGVARPQTYVSTYPCTIVIVPLHNNVHVYRERERERERERKKNGHNLYQYSRSQYKGIKITKINCTCNNLLICGR